MLILKRQINQWNSTETPKIYQNTYGYIVGHMYKREQWENISNIHYVLLVYLPTYLGKIIKLDAYPNPYQKINSRCKKDSNIFKNTLQI